MSCDANQSDPGSPAAIDVKVLPCGSGVYP